MLLKELFEIGQLLLLHGVQRGAAQLSHMRRGHAQNGQFVGLALQCAARGHHDAQLVEIGGHLDTAAPLDLAVVLARLLLLLAVDLWIAARHEQTTSCAAQAAKAAETAA